MSQEDVTSSEENVTNRPRYPVSEMLCCQIFERRNQSTRIHGKMYLRMLCFSTIFPFSWGFVFVIFVLLLGLWWCFTFVLLSQSSSCRYSLLVYPTILTQITKRQFNKTSWWRTIEFIWICPRLLFVRILAFGWNPSQILQTCPILHDRIYIYDDGTPTSRNDTERSWPNTSSWRRRPQETLRSIQEICVTHSSLVRDSLTCLALHWMSNDSRDVL